MAALVLVLVLVLCASTVLALSPLQVTLQSNATTGPGTVAQISGYSFVAVQVVTSGGFDRTITFEGSVDGSTYTGVTCRNSADTSAALVTSTTAAGTYHCGVGGFSRFRTPLAGGTGGTATITGRFLEQVSFVPTESVGGGGGGTVTGTGTPQALARWNVSGTGIEDAGLTDTGSVVISTRGQRDYSISTNANITLSLAQNLVNITTGAADKTATLPPALNLIGQHFSLTKVDAAASTGGIILCPSGTDTINGVAACTTPLTCQFCGYDVQGVTATNWRVSAVTRLPADYLWMNDGNGNLVGLSPALAGCVRSDGVTFHTGNCSQGISIGDPVTNSTPNSVLITDAGHLLAEASIPDCDDTGGRHLNRDATTGTWSCGTSNSGGGGGLGGTGTTGTIAQFTGITTVGNSPLTVSGNSLGMAVSAAPSTPSAGTEVLWFDTTDKRLHDKNDAGAVGTTVVADAGASNNFLTGISAAGVITKARPSCASLSDAGIGCTSGTAGSGTVNSGTAGNFSYYAATGTAVSDSGIATANVCLLNVADIFTNVTAPSTPASGKTVMWFDTTDRRLHDKNDAGTVGTTIIPTSSTPNNYITAVSSAGIVTKGRPSCSTLSDSGPGCNAPFDNPTAVIGSTAVNGVAGTFMRSDAAPALNAAYTKRSFTFTFTGNGSALTPGNSLAAEVPYACTISGWAISVSTADTATFKLWVASTGTAIPTVANNRNTSGVSISTGTHVRSTTVTDFALGSGTAIAANDIVIAQLSAVGGSTQGATFQVECTLP